MKKFVSFLAVVVICAATSTSHATLLSQYTFDDTANNAVTGAPNGTLVGSPSYVTGQLGNAISLDGSTQYVDCSTGGFPKASVFGATSNGLWAGSAAFWVNTTSSTIGSVVCAMNASANTMVNLNVNGNNLDQTATGNLAMYFRSNTGASQYFEYVGSPTINWRDGEWHQITMAWQHTTGTANTGSYDIYIDGAKQTMAANKSGSFDPATNTFTAWANPMRIGALGRATPTAGYNFSGALDDVAVWNTKLTDTQTKAIFSVGSEATLLYNATNAQTLLDLFASGPSHQANTSDGKTWSYVTGLSTDPALVGTLVGGRSLILDGSGNGVQFVPEPSTLSLLVMAIAGILAYAWRKRK